MSIHTRAALVLCCALPAVGAGCVEPEGTLVIQCVAGGGYEADEDTGELLPTEAGTCEESGAGTIFPAAVAGRLPLYLNAFFINQMAEDARLSTLRVDSRDVLISEYEIAIETLDGTAGPITVPGAGFVPAGEGAGQAGTAQVGFYAGNELTQSLTRAQTAVLRVRFFGRTTGGDDVETPWAYYPIIVAE
jgi:hypothetical protein